MEKNNISDILLAPWIMGVTTTVIILRVFSLISDQELAVEEIAVKCQVLPDRLTKLLDACVSLGYLELENGRYRNSHFSLVYFVEGQRLYMGDFIRLIHDESPPLLQLPDTIRSSKKIEQKPPYIRSDYRTFIRAMNNIGNLGEAEALRDFVDLSGCKKMIDAGGGSGLYSVSLCQKYPELHSTIMDVKETLEVTGEMIADRREKSRITLREGDILKESWGVNMDVALLSDLIYEEETAGIVLRNAWNCLAPNGILIIRGYYADPEESRPLFGALFAVKELADDPRRNIITQSLLEKMVSDTGFKITRAAPLTEFSFALVGRK
jgi:SAM-dependent methyltransferase